MASQAMFEVTGTTFAILGVWFGARAANRSKSRRLRGALVIGIVLFMVYPPIRIAVRPGALFAGGTIAAAVIVFGKRTVKK